MTNTSTKSAEPAMVDTNVLVYATDKKSTHHRASRRLLDRAKSDPNAGLCVSSQILAEFYAIVTSPKRVSTPRSPEEACASIETILSRPGITVLPIRAEAVPTWLALARQSQPVGPQVFDLQIAGTMLANGVHRIYTYNRSDFEKLPGIDVLTP